MVARIAGNRRLSLVLIAIVVLLAAGTTAARAMTSGGGTRYRTAVAGNGSVDQELTGVGSVSAVNRVSVAFPVAGTVASVPVSVGTKVSAGQVLARLSPTALDQALDTANANLASAQQTLASDQASQTESTATESADVSGPGDSIESADAIVLTAALSGRPTGSTAPTGSTGPTGSTSATGGSSLTRSIAQVAADQRTVLGAQQKLDADLTAAEAALATCQNALSSPAAQTPPTSGASTPPPAASPSGTSVAPSSASTSGASDDASATCLAAIAAAPNKATVTADQQARDRAESQLDAAVSQLEAAAKKAAASSGSSSGSGSGRSSGAGGSSSTGGSSGQSSGTNGYSGSGPSGSSRTSTGTGTGTSGNGSNAGSSRSSGPASAAQLAADQAQIDAAQARLVVARQNLAAATLTSPLTGTVAAVSITAGKTAGSSSTITVIGSGQSQVSTTVALADIGKVKVGDEATVKVDGISSTLSGKVALIGILNTTSGSSTSYPVTILLDPTSQKLYDGSGAATQIQIASVADVLTVPSSAVHTVGGFSTVTVLNNGKPTVTRVTVGAVGTDRTQVLTGLKAGQTVVLADLNQKLPTSSS